MKRFEIQPYIKSQNIGEIEVFVELTKEEVEKVKVMTKKDFSAFIKSKATVRITDFDVDYDAETFEDWVESEDIDNIKANIKQLKLKLSIAEKALNRILNWQEDVDGDWDYPETIASNALEKLAKIDGF